MALLAGSVGNLHLDLILRVITVSLETLRIVRSLPHIDFALCK